MDGNGAQLLAATCQGGRGVTRSQHGVRIGFLMALAALLLGWLAAHTEVLFADGLRYIGQAQQIAQGAWRDGLLGAVDHPVYPAAIAACHEWLGVGGDNSEESWQLSAQVASVICGVLLVIPLYLLGLELFGPGAAWLGVVLFFLSPLTGHTLADALSEGTFALFWTWGLWTSLRFLRQGTFGWLPATSLLGALAYLTRPEGLLLPAALVVTLLFMPFLRSTRLNWPRWWAAIAFLTLGPLLVVGPFIAIKGGLGTKPAIARLLGTAPRSAPDAVERARPLEPGQSELKTYGLAVKAVWEAVREMTSVPLVPLAVLGLFLALRRPGPLARAWLFLTVLGMAATLALIRLYVTGGYCTPRHAFVLSLILIPAAGFGLERLLGSISVPGRLLGLGEGRFTAGPAVWALVLVGLGLWSARQLFEPINFNCRGYRQAGDWLASIKPEDTPVVDVTGWSLFYGHRRGYTFATLHDALSDPEVRWIIVRESHLKGRWWYCHVLREMIGHREPIRQFPEDPESRQAHVYVFDRTTPEVATVSWAPPGPIR